jgi:hypothetical protein
MHPAFNIVRGVVCVAVIVRQLDLLSPRRDIKAYKKALESSRAREMYLANIIDKNDFEIDEFDRIALTQM